MRILFMGTPEFALPSLRSLIWHGHSISLVVTQPDRPRGRGRKLTPSPVKLVAEEHGIPVAQPEDVNSDDCVQTLRVQNPDTIVVVAFGQLLRQNILNLPPEGCINVHASLLPKYRGAAPIHRAIINGDNLTGVTTMHMTEGMDAGDAILRRETAILDSDTVQSLSTRLADIGGELLSETLAMIEKGQTPRLPQDPVEVTYAPKIEREDARITWTSPAEDVRNLVRGTNPYPGAFTHFRDSALKVWQVEAATPRSVHGRCGEIIDFGPAGTPVICTGNGFLLLEALQPQDRKRMTGADWVRGARVHRGDVLG